MRVIPDLEYGWLQCFGDLLRKSAVICLSAVQSMYLGTDGILKRSGRCARHSAECGCGAPGERQSEHGYVELGDCGR